MKQTMSEAVLAIVRSLMPWVCIALKMALVIFSWLKSVTVPSLFLILPTVLTMIRLLLLCPAHKPGNFAGDVLKSTLPETMAKINSLSALSHILCSYCRENTKYCISRADSTPSKTACQALLRDIFKLLRERWILSTFGRRPRKHS